MWESVLKMQQLEIQINSGDKAVRLRIREEAAAAASKALELSQSELFELMHTFLTINRTFNQEVMYYDEA
ncbi:hypothetical protein [Paenibacillus sp. tmac-D7]|uniref:hypothetical protein n=1 Tax=Paenibacillus sp. tmac-D7 TaxID=2591462 RepID=UPI0011423E1A|nr:hypothetical protein [Paenibacillus sp. tmac-D7]